MDVLTRSQSQSRLVGFMGKVEGVARKGVDLPDPVSIQSVFIFCFLAGSNAVFIFVVLRMCLLLNVC